MEIYHKDTGKLLFADDHPKLAETVADAIKAGVDLTGARLHGLEVFDAVRRAERDRVSLRGCDLRWAGFCSGVRGGQSLDLRGSDLRGSDWRYARPLGGNVDLSGCDLRGAMRVHDKLVPGLWVADLQLDPAPQPVENRVGQLTGVLIRVEDEGEKRGFEMLNLDDATRSDVQFLGSGLPEAPGSDMRVDVDKHSYVGLPGPGFHVCAVRIVKIATPSPSGYGTSESWRYEFSACRPVAVPTLATYRKLIAR